MKKYRKFIIIGALLLLSAYYLPVFYKFYKYQHHFEKNFNKFIWIFNEPYKSKIDTFIFGGKSRERDVFYNYFYCKNTKKDIFISDNDTAYYITIWEFKDLEKINLKNTIIKNNRWLNDIKFKLSEGFNYSDSFPLITLKLGFEFIKPAMNVNLDYPSSIYKTIDNNNYKGFFGKINKMSFSDAEGEHLILFEYKNASPTLFLMYKARQSFYVIIVNSNHKFDENIIDIFNLK